MRTRKIMILAVALLTFAILAGGCDPKEQVIQYVVEGKFDEARQAVYEAYPNGGEKARTYLLFINDQEGKAYAQYLVIEDGWKWTNEGYGYSHISGRVKNTGTKTVSYFEVVAKFRNTKDGEVINSDYTNSGQDLAPGESIKFDLLHKNDSDEKWVTLSIGDVTLR